MDVEKLIQAAEWCKRHRTCDNCEYYSTSLACYNPKCFHRMMNQTTDVHAEMILAVRDHYKAEGRAEGRAEVIAQVREHIRRIKTYECLDKYLAIEIKRLSDKLDELAWEDGK